MLVARRHNRRLDAGRQQPGVLQSSGDKAFVSNRRQASALQCGPKDLKKNRGEQFARVKAPCCPVLYRYVMP
jgi:hypothetical protein